MMRSRATRLVALIFGLLLFMYFVLAIAQAGGASSCHWAFPKWFGCVLSAHEALAGGLIGAAGALSAAWIAWTAVQAQISAERERMMADRIEAERLLAEDLTDYADGMAAAWRLLVALPERTDPESTGRVREATAHMAERLSRPEPIANYRGMARILGWERRTKYNALITRLEQLKAFNDPSSTWDLDEALDAIRHLSNDFENCLPTTSDYFEGLWRRSPKARTFADRVDYIGSAPPTDKQHG
jgi:hypothetical protein